MKGFLRTAEAGIGVIIVLGLILSLTPEQEVDRTGIETAADSVSEHLSTLSSSGELREMILEDDSVEEIENVLQRGTLNVDSQVETVHELYYTFEYNDQETFEPEGSEGRIVAWSSESVEVSFNGEQVLDGNLDGDSTEIEFDTGENTIEVDDLDVGSTRILIEERNVEGETPETGRATRILERTTRINESTDSLTRVFVHEE